MSKTADITMDRVIYSLYIIAAWFISEAQSLNVTTVLQCNGRNFDSCVLSMSGWPELYLKNVERQQRPAVYGSEAESIVQGIEFYTGDLIGKEAHGGIYMTAKRGSHTLDGSIRISEQYERISFHLASFANDSAEYVGISWVDKQIQPHKKQYYAEGGNICALNIDVDHMLYEAMGKDVERIYSLVYELVYRLKEYFSDILLPNDLKLQFSLSSIYLATDEVCNSCSCSTCSFFCQTNDTDLWNHRSYISAYNRYDHSSYCASILLTGMPYAPNEDSTETIGNAYTDSLCTPDLNSATVRVQEEQATLVILHALAHEIGHMIGALHAPDQNGLMAPKMPEYYSLLLDHNHWKLTPKNKDNVERFFRHMYIQGDYCLTKHRPDRPNEHGTNYECDTKSAQTDDKDVIIIILSSIIAALILGCFIYIIYKRCCLHKAKSKSQCNCSQAEMVNLKS